MELTLKGADVLLPDGLAQCDVNIADGEFQAETASRKVDVSGYWVLPAMVDIHGDGFERHLAPRRGVLRDLGQGLQSVDAELASSGIGTAVLAQFFSWEGGMRSPEFARRFLSSHHCADLLTDTLVQLRFETHLLEDYDDFHSLVDQYAVPYVVFNDHLPHDALDKGKRPPRLTGQALKSGRSPEAHLALLQRLHGQSDEVAQQLPLFAERLATSGVILGSHDDETPAQVQLADQSGIQISEFPVTRAAVETAAAFAKPVVLGAPNVVRGGSHSGQLSAIDMIAENLCSALASDYHYPSLKQAVFRLVDDGALALKDAWRLVSKGPAEVLGLTDRGEISPGKRADFVVMNPVHRRVEATFVAGKVSYLSGDLAARLIG